MPRQKAGAGEPLQFANALLIERMEAFRETSRVTPVNGEAMKAIRPKLAAMIEIGLNQIMRHYDLKIYPKTPEIIPACPTIMPSISKRAVCL